MGSFPAMPHDPLDVPCGFLASLPTPSATISLVVSAVPSDKRACAFVAPPLEPQADSKSAARTDPNAKDKVAANGLVSTL